MTKFEFVDKDVYHVTAIYIEIDAKSYVLEMVSKVTDETIFEGYGKSKFIDYITEYNKNTGTPFREIGGVYQFFYFLCYGDEE